MIGGSELKSVHDAASVAVAYWFVLRLIWRSRIVGFPLHKIDAGSIVYVAVG